LPAIEWPTHLAAKARDMCPWATMRTSHGPGFAPATAGAWNSRRISAMSASNRSSTCAGDLRSLAGPHPDSTGEGGPTLRRDTRPPKCPTAPAAPPAPAARGSRRSSAPRSRRSPTRAPRGSPAPSPRSARGPARAPSARAAPRGSRGRAARGCAWRVAGGRRSCPPPEMSSSAVSVEGLLGGLTRGRGWRAR
jgi:hypothetical protein